MIILYFLIIPILYILIKLILYFLIRRYGKISYDGFSAMGFAYDSKRDLFYSTKNAWQKNFGYCHLYDVMAPPFRIIVDTEPVRFNYNNKNWLITFWKGQYGIVTGAEIGVYNTMDTKVNKKTIYMPANEEEMLNMSFILYRKGKIIAKVKSRHWWLAIFKMAMFTKPKDLTMDICINFPNKQMLNAFLQSFKKLGYSNKQYCIFDDNTFCFYYKKPHSRKVWTRSLISDAIILHLNRKNVDLYNKYLEDSIDNNRIDDSKEKINKKYIFIDKMIPGILKNSKENKLIENLDVHKVPHNVIFLNDNIFSTIERIKYE